MGENHEDKQTEEDHMEGMTRTNGGESRGQMEAIITDRDKVQERIMTGRNNKDNA